MMDELNVVPSECNNIHMTSYALDLIGAELSAKSSGKSPSEKLMIAE